jgi:hypothetical protein
MLAGRGEWLHGLREHRELDELTRDREKTGELPQSLWLEPPCCSVHSQPGRFRRGLLGCVAIVAALAVEVDGQRSRYQVVDESTITRTLTFGGAGDRALDVRVINGRIRVVGTNDSTVQMTIRKAISAETDADFADAQRDVRLDFVERTPRVEAIVRDASGHVCGEPSFGDRNWSRVRYNVRFDFTIQVPKQTRLRLCTINGGDITVQGTEGDFEVDNVNGEIEMDQVVGSGSARTVNGPVSVSFAANPTAPSTFYTVNGTVEVMFQDGLSADFKMKTFNGGLFTDFEVEPLAQSPAPTPERRNGRLVYRTNDFTRVRVGGGGPEHTFETLNGSVRALRAR